jgi:hypothetical protein
LGEGFPLPVLEAIRQPVVHPIGWLDASADVPSGHSGSRGAASDVREAAPITSLDQRDG